MNCRDHQHVLACPAQPSLLGFAPPVSRTLSHAPPLPRTPSLSRPQTSRRRARASGKKAGRRESSASFFVTRARLATRFAHWIST